MALESAAALQSKAAGTNVLPPHRPLQPRQGPGSLCTKGVGCPLQVNMQICLHVDHFWGSSCTKGRTGWLQVNMQALVLVSVFRQQTRDKLVEYIEWCLPDRIPWLWDRMGYRHTPAQMVHNAIVSKIGAFQAGVARRQSASHQDPRQALRRCDSSCRRRLVTIIRSPQAGLVGRTHVVLFALPAGAWVGWQLP